MASYFRMLTALFAIHIISLALAGDVEYFNPVLPGWHSDPSCVQAKGTFYCITSTFISFPGIPVYASTDLINWRLISHVWNRASQMPGASEVKWQQGGFFAATIRHHEDKFWVACEYLGLEQGILGTIFTSTDPYDEAAWGDPFVFPTQAGDLDLFWDDDGTFYIPGGGSGATLQRVNLETGEVISNIYLWPGTGGVWPEGPHIYRKDGWYYLSMAEGGTELGHYQVMARSRNLTGPYTPCPYNPVLTNKGTNEYFQTIGHADLFQDTNGNWWGVALATRSGPEWSIYPMGRETVLFPVIWPEGDWPIMEPVRGKMNGLKLPPVNKNPPGNGPLNSDPDIYDFPAGSQIPRNLIFWRVPFEGAFSIPSGGGLQIVPSCSNLTGDNGELDGRSGLSFIGRRQTDSLFTFYADIQTDPQHIGQEAGVTIFLTQNNHVDLGVVLVSHHNGTNKGERVLRFRATGDASPEERILPIPSSWGLRPIRFQISTINSTHYSLVASPAWKPDDKRLMGIVSARLVSGQSGPFTGTLIGAYATCNGAADGLECPPGGKALISRWRYTGEGQYYTSTDFTLPVQ